VFTVKLAKFLMFAVSKKVLLSVWRVLRISSAMVGPLRLSSKIFGSLRESLEAFRNLKKNVVKWPKIP